MGLYQAPVHRAAGSGDEWTDTAQFHIGFYPPLLRSSTVKKFLVGSVVVSLLELSSVHHADDDTLSVQIRALC